MSNLGSYLLLASAIFAAIPVAVFILEVFSALFLRQPDPLKHSVLARPSVAVLIPAHNESVGILLTLSTILSQIGPSDRVLVVADNCSDDTCQIAASAGAEVIERQDPSHRGKGYALDFGIRHLAKRPPEAVIVIDADCFFLPGSIDTLASTCQAESRPVQALNLMRAPEDQPGTFQFAEFAWRVKNWVRPLGLRALRLPCQLTGTGMAFPWDVIKSANLASGEIVEDLKLGLELAKVGKAPVFCPSACVVSHFPSTQAGSDSQRQRWEQGHLNMIARRAPQMLWNAIANRNLGAMILSLDLAVPPLVLLISLQLGLFLLSAVAAAFGASPASLYIVASAIAFLAVSIGLCWFAYGRDVFPVKKLFTLPLVIIEKFALYRRLMSGSRDPPQWIRTDRSKLVQQKNIDLSDGLS
jgi:cellulose synthase/poly-beta-1,6-N-acetylglucosamine synthase-like glycosyltransferase